MQTSGVVQYPSLSSCAMAAVCDTTYSHGGLKIVSSPGFWVCSLAYLLVCFAAWYYNYSIKGQRCYYIITHYLQ